MPQSRRPPNRQLPLRLRRITRSLWDLVRWIRFVLVEVEVEHVVKMAILPLPDMAVEVVEVDIPRPLQGLQYRQGRYWLAQ